MIFDRGQEVELLSRHLMYLCSHSMPHVHGVLLGTVSVAICHQGPLWLAAVSSVSGYGLPLVLNQWTRVEGPHSGPECSSQDVL